METKNSLKNDYAKLAEAIMAHGNTVRRVTNEGVLAACPATTMEGFLCTELSAPLSTRQAVRDWLGY